MSFVTAFPWGVVKLERKKSRKYKVLPAFEFMALLVSHLASEVDQKSFVFARKLLRTHVTHPKACLPRIATAADQEAFGLMKSELFLILQRRMRCQPLEVARE